MIIFLSNLSNLVSDPDPDRQTRDGDLDPVKLYGSDRIRIRNNENCKTLQRNSGQHNKNWTFLCWSGYEKTSIEGRWRDGPLLAASLASHQAAQAHSPSPQRLGAHTFTVLCLGIGGSGSGSSILGQCGFICRVLMTRTCKCYSLRKIPIFKTRNCSLFIPRPTWRTAKLLEKPQPVLRIPDPKLIFLRA